MKLTQLIQLLQQLAAIKGNENAEVIIGLRSKDSESSDYKDEFTPHDVESFICQWKEEKPVFVAIVAEP